LSTLEWSSQGVLQAASHPLAGIYLLYVELDRLGTDVGGMENWAGIS